MTRETDDREAVVVVRRMRECFCFSAAILIGIRRTNVSGCGTFLRTSTRCHHELPGVADRWIPEHIGRTERYAEPLADPLRQHHRRDRVSARLKKPIADAEFGGTQNFVPQ